MGTSTSSSGPGPRVSMDPPWLDTLTGGEGGEAPDPVLPQEDNQQDGARPNRPAQQDAAPEGAIAPPRRFGSARRDLGAFARSGGTDRLARGIGHYSRTGMGGARQAARRMRASTHAGAGLVSFLQQVSEGASAEIRRWVDELVASNPSADVVVDAIVDAVMPTGGSADEESIRDSMALALSDLIALSPDCNPLQMSPDDTWTLIQLYLSQEVCNRLRFDTGQFFESARLNPAVAVQREMEMREFIKNEVGEQLRGLRERTPNPSRQQLDSLMQDALRLTFEVYEGVL